MITVVVTGPESTGKTKTSEFLARRLKGVLIPEFAREYIIHLNRRYTYSDVETIARTQVKQRRDIDENKPGFLILDTWLIITKVWFMEIYGKYPEWIDEAIYGMPVDLYLLCNTEIPWVEDPVRENGGERRDYLFELYKQEIIKTGTPYEIITGQGRSRFRNALEIVQNHFKISR